MHCAASQNPALPPAESRDTRHRASHLSLPYHFWLPASTRSFTISLPRHSPVSLLSYNYDFISSLFSGKATRRLSQHFPSIYRSRKRTRKLDSWQPLPGCKLRPQSSLSIPNNYPSLRTRLNSLHPLLACISSIWPLSNLSPWTITSTSTHLST